MRESGRLIYVHDPMCSWCWGFRPTFERLGRQLPDGLATRHLLGGLAADDTQPMAEDMRRRLQATWRRIETRIPGTVFNHAFWERCRPRRSTWPACRAVIVARRHDVSLEAPMIDAIQRAYYVDARDPSDRATLVALAGEIGLDRKWFDVRLDAAAPRSELSDEIAEARRMGADSFPSLRLQIGDSIWPIAVHYTEVQPMLESIAALLDD